MKIYNMIRIDMDTGTVLEEDSFEYDGPVAQCGGGGGDTFDPVYNAGMLALSEEQQSWARDLFNWSIGKSEGHYEGGETPEVVRITGASGGTDEDGRPLDDKPDTWEVDGQPFTSQEEAEAYAAEQATDKTWVEGIPTGENSYYDLQNAQIDANMEMMPGENALSMETTQAQRDLLPGQTALTGAQNDAALSLLPSQTEFAQAGLESALSLMPAQTFNAQQKLDSEIFLQPHKTAADHAQLMYDKSETYAKGPAMLKFYEESAKGVDVEARANAAQADAAQAFMGAEGSMNRSMSRSGVAPGSGQFSSQNNALAIDKAKAMGAAKTQGRNNAEAENFGRLQTAMNYGG